jgi:hypothetical protein
MKIAYQPSISWSFDFILNELKILWICDGNVVISSQEVDRF